MATIAVALMHSSVPLALTEALPPDGVAVPVLRDMLTRQLRSRVRLVDGITFKPLRSTTFLAPPAFVRVTFVHPQPRRPKSVVPASARQCTFAALFGTHTDSDTDESPSANESALADDDEAQDDAEDEVVDETKSKTQDTDTDSCAGSIFNAAAAAAMVAEPRPPCPSGALAVGLVVDVVVQCMRCLRAPHDLHNHTLVGVTVARTTRVMALKQRYTGPADVAMGLVAAELAVRAATDAVPACRRIVLHTSVIGLDTRALQACAAVQRVAASRPVTASFVACTAPEATALRRAMVRADARGAYFRLPKGQAGTDDDDDGSEQQ